MFLIGLALLSVPTVKGLFHDHGWWLAFDVVLLVGLAAILGNAAMMSLLRRRRDRTPE